MLAGTLKEGLVLPEKIKVLELFGGIGAPRKALERLGIPFESVDYVDTSKYACRSYNILFGEAYMPQDVTTWNKDLKVDLIVHGSPCQDFSANGKQLGGDEGSGTRSSLMYETVRIVSKLKPKYVIWENVKNVISKKHKHNFDKYLHLMSELGYTNYYQVLNAADYGIPQNRERVFTVSILGEHKPFEWPEKQALKISLHDLLETEVDDKYYLSDKQIESRKNSSWESTEYKKCLLNNKNIHPTLMTSPTSLLEDKRGVRKLTCVEYWKFMGFRSEDVYKVKAAGISDTQLYHQAGNSIVVDVLIRLFECLFKDDENGK